MELKLKTTGKAAAGSVSVSDEVFAKPFNEAVVHQVVTAYLAGARQGTKAQKNRSDVSGGGAKPWRQKGTGRARAGTIRSPIWRSGGVTFAARPRDYSQKVNKKMYRGALAIILSELIRQERLDVVKELSVKEAKTREAVALFKILEFEAGLIVTAEYDEKLVLAARNIPNIEVLSAEKINTVSLVGANKVVMTADAIKKIEERLS